MKTILLKDKALRIAKAMMSVRDEAQKELDGINAAIDDLNAEAERIKDRAQAAFSTKHAALKKELGLAPNAHAHVDFSYTADHGLVFVTTGCEPAKEGLH